MNSQKKLSVKCLAVVTHSTQTLQGLSRGFGWVWRCGPSHGQHLRVANTLGKNLPCCPRPAQAQWQLLWQELPQRPELASPAWMQKYQPFNRSARVPWKMKKKALMYFKPGCHSKSLGFLFTSLSSLILQPAQKGKQVPWNKPASNSCTKRIIKPTCGFGSPDSYHNSIKAVPCPQF